jgi:hypothetical protein
MNESDFTELLIQELRPRLRPHKVEAKRSLLYDLSFDHLGTVAFGVDPETGTPIKGGGRGFEQDLLVFDEVESKGANTSVIPRVVAELKYGGVNTHDVIVYSEKADRIRRVYPYVRYGFVLGGLWNIPGRALRLGQRFDFITSISPELRPEELRAFCDMMCDEAAASASITELLFEQKKSPLFGGASLFEWPDRALPDCASSVGGGRHRSS